MPSTPTPGVCRHPRDPTRTSTSSRTPWAQRFANPKSVHALAAPLFVVGMLVVADSCSCPLFSLFGDPKTQHGSITLPKSSVTPGGSAVRPALVQHAFQHAESDSNALAFPQAVQAGDLVVVVIASAFRTVTAVVDSTSGQTSPSDTYQRVEQPLTVDPQNQHTHLELWDAHNVQGRALAVTVLFSPSSSPYTSGETDVGIYEYSGLNTAAPVEQATAAVGSGNTPDGGTLTTSSAQEALYFVARVDTGPDDAVNTTPATAGTGYTLLDHQDNARFERFYTEEQIAPRGTYAPNFTIAYPSDWGGIGAAFRP